MLCGHPSQGRRVCERLDCPQRAAPPLGCPAPDRPERQHLRPVSRRRPAGLSRDRPARGGQVLVEGAGRARWTLPRPQARRAAPVPGRAHPRRHPAPLTHERRPAPRPGRTRRGSTAPRQHPVRPRRRLTRGNPRSGTFFRAARRSPASSGSSSPAGSSSAGGTAVAPGLASGNDSWCASLAWLGPEMVRNLVRAS